ncbi:OmpA family protein [Polyangium aurulentum]|uniref:OmpA family protein n=1 Tax=Polyangium aurulentum TaxID=2567896 RepID=UPI0010AE5961|nr:OmpA family protein [Polyangium aurulentum]UQA55185.1 OmpA family protein [Polyangium aurulentum]
MPRPSRALSTALVATALALAASRASAQTSAGRVALDPLEPTPTGDALLAVPSPRIGGHLVPRGAVLFEYASRPLLIGDEVALVSAQGFLRADVSLALFDRLLVSVHMPVAVLQSGEDPQIEGLAVTPPSGVAPGDLRLGLRGRILGASDRAPFQLGLGGYFFVPTAPDDAYVGEGAVRADLHALLGGRAGPVAWSASGGIHLRASDNPHAIRFGAGAAVLLADDRVSLGVDVHGLRPLEQTLLITSPATRVTAEPRIGLELLGEARLRVFSGLTVGAAAGPGLLAGLGTPSFRALVQLGWAPPGQTPRDKPTGRPEAGDRDGDGFRDDIDACPDEKGELSGDPSKDGCPPPDRDKDGILDLDDACPLIAGDRSEDSAKSGCPRDGDADGIPDREDACPAEKGLASDRPKKRGCPSDRDDDGIFDTLDACPDKAGIAAPDPIQRGCPADMDGDGVAYPEDACPRERGAPDAEQKGCPRFVRLKGDEIVLGKRVAIEPSFRAKGGVVARASMPVLEEIRALLEDHPEITKLEVQGHTSDAGDVKKKLALSQQEAELVRRTLVELGVPEEKLAARGYGHKRPIADNRLPEGRVANHRIAFAVIERKK